MIRLFAKLAFICLLSSTHGFQYKEYWIKSGDSYLFREFKDVKEPIFPHILRISLSVSKFSGTLFYSIDRNKNQFIVSLKEDVRPQLTIKTSLFKHGKTESVWISDLCECDLCKYENIDIRFQVKETNMILQCNNGNKTVIKLDDIEIKNKRLDPGFPDPFNGNGGNGGNEAKLWIVNTPHTSNSQPNSEQLAGCIFNVSYGDIPLIFTNITDNVKELCNRSCNDNICNGGQCYETYNDTPLCNCTITLLNGNYCNKTANITNVVSVSSYRFSIVKLSWKNSSNEIMELQNENTSISIFGKCNRLILEYRSKNKEPVRTISNLLETYNMASVSILVANMKNDILDIMLLHNGSWHQTQVLVRPNIQEELFTNLTLSSGDAIIDLSYKNSARQIEWTAVQIKNIRNFVKRTSEICADKKDSSISPGCIVIIVIIAVIASIIIVILIAVIFKYGLKTGRNNNRQGNSERPEDIRLEDAPAKSLINSETIHTSDPII